LCETGPGGEGGGGGHHDLQMVVSGELGTTLSSMAIRSSAANVWLTPTTTSQKYIDCR
jgi:hypothetical protein